MSKAVDTVHFSDQELIETLEFLKSYPGLAKHEAAQGSPSDLPCLSPALSLKLHQAFGHLDRSSHEPSDQIQKMGSRQT